MKSLVKKEIRLLLPAWIAAMLLAVIPAWVAGVAWNLNDSINQAQSHFWLEGLVPVIFALGILVLGISPFGQEFSLGTFTVLLSQPAERWRVWRAKIITVAVAFLTVWFAAVVSLWCQYFLYDYLHPPYWHKFTYVPPGHYLFLYGDFQPFSGAFYGAIGFMALAVLVVFSGGLWTTLLLRQITNAFWFTLLTPLAIILGISSWLSDRIASDQSIGRIIVAALAVYSVAGFWAARLLFRRCQDLQSAGGEVSFPWSKKFAGLGTVAISFWPRHRYSALIWKEIQLHQVNLLIAALLLLLHLSSFFARLLHPHFSNPDLQFVLENIWLLWLLMPILIGCSAIADERRLGIMESQLTLPVTRRRQLLIKFSVALVLGLLLGAVVPLLVEGTKHLDDSLFLVAGALLFISFYASSLARTVLQAIGLAIIVGVAMFFYEIITAINVFQHQQFNFVYPGQFGLDLLKVYLGLPILLLTLTALTFWNYKQLRQNTALLLANLLTVLGVCAGIFLLTHAIYFRAWEYVMPTLPLRGPARLSDTSQLKLAASSAAIYATLPDGRLWVQNRNYYFFSPGNFAVSFKGQSAFVPGTNWADTAADNFQGVGIRSDGSLWSIQRAWSTSGYRMAQSGPFTLAQIGSDTDWSQAASGSIGFLLLKKDGSLWVWGTNGFVWSRFQSSVSGKLKSDLAAPPGRLGVETNWTRLYSTGVPIYAMNDHGDVWSWMAWIGTNDVSQLAREYAANGPWSYFLPQANDSYLGIKTNGELWVSGHVQLSRWEGGSETRSLGTHQTWKAAIFANGNDILAMRSDGTLWKFNNTWNLGPHMISEQPVQLGHQSDWVGFAGGNQSMAPVVAADGSIWSWYPPTQFPWLTPSRKPLYLGNLFQGTESLSYENDH